MVHALFAALIPFVALPASPDPSAPAERAVVGVNVRDFGAKGDGATDDTEAFHAAMRRAKKVLVPSGIYRVNLDLAKARSDGVTVEGVGYGDGSNGTILKGFDETRPILSGRFSASAPLYKATLRYLTLNQTGGRPATGNHGIALSYVYHLSMDNVYVVNAGGWGMLLEHVLVATLRDCQVHKGVASRGLGGVAIVEQGNAITIIGGAYNGSGLDERTPAFAIRGQAGGIRFVGTDAEHWGTGVVLDNSRGKITDISIEMWLERNNLADVQIGVKKSPPENFVAGVDVAGNFAGPVSRGGHAVLLWGSTLFGINVHPSYVTNRLSVVDIDPEATHYGTRIHPAYNGAAGDAGFVPLLTGKVTAGIELDEGGRRSEGFASLPPNEPFPSVRRGNLYLTSNSQPTLIKGFVDGRDGQRITVVVNDRNTAVDFSSRMLSGNGGAVWRPSLHAHMTCVYADATTHWHCDLAAGGP